MHEVLLVTNPARRKTRRKTAAKRTGRTKNPVRRTAAQRAATRKLIAFNKRRGRGRKRTTTTRRRRRNPNPNPTAVRRRPRRRRAGMFDIQDILTEQVVPASIAAGGALLLDVIWGFLPIPITFKAGNIKYLAKGVGALSLGAIARFATTKKTADTLAAGALTVVIHEALREMTQQFMPDLVLGAYVGYEDTGGAMGYAGAGSVVGNNNYAEDGMGVYVGANANDGMGALPGAYDPALGPDTAELDTMEVMY